MSKLLVVVGATGLQGGSVIKYFQQHEPSWKLRGLTRNPSSDVAVTLAKSGVDVVKADLNDLESLKSAFKGATAIFAYTDFGGMVPGIMERFMKGGISPPVGAEILKTEFLQGKNVADAAASVPDLERLIWSSLPNVTKWSKGKYTQVFHFDSKAQVTEYMLGMKALKGKVSMVMMGSFTTNLSKGLDWFDFKQQPDGTAVWRSMTTGDTTFPWIDVEKDTGAFVKALIEAPAPTHVLGVSEFLSANQWLELWTAHTGVKSRFESIPPETFIADDPSGLKTEFQQTFLFVNEFGFAGGDPDVILPDELEQKGFRVPRTKISDHIKREDWSRVLG